MRYQIVYKELWYLLFLTCVLWWSGCNKTPEILDLNKTVTELIFVLEKENFLKRDTFENQVILINSIGYYDYDKENNRRMSGKLSYGSDKLAFGDQIIKLIPSEEYIYSCAYDRVHYLSFGVLDSQNYSIHVCPYVDLADNIFIPPRDSDWFKLKATKVEGYWNFSYLPEWDDIEIIKK